MNIVVGHRANVIEIVLNLATATLVLHKAHTYSIICHSSPHAVIEFGVFAIFVPTQVGLGTRITIIENRWGDTCCVLLSASAEKQRSLAVWLCCEHHDILEDCYLHDPVF